MRQFKGKHAVMLTNNQKEIFQIDFIDHREYYCRFFNNNVEKQIIKGEEYVYLMVNTATSLIKIGKSINPIYRERTLHSQEPTVHLIAVWCCNMTSIEKDLHERYKLKRVRGEWFRLTIPDLSDIENFMNNL